MMAMSQEPVQRAQALRAEIEYHNRRDHKLADPDVGGAVSALLAEARHIQPVMPLANGSVGLEPARLE